MTTALLTPANQNFSWPWIGDMMGMHGIVWNDEVSDDPHVPFGETVHSMIVASIPTDCLKAVENAYEALKRLGVDFPICSGGWPLMCELTKAFKTPNVSNQDVEIVLGIFKDEYGKRTEANAPNWDSIKVQIPLFVKEVQYCALATLWRFMRLFSTFLVALRKEIVADLANEWLQMASLEVICQLQGGDE